MKNTIAERVADFLKHFPPFDQLSKKDVLSISQEVTISNCEKGKLIYNKNKIQFHQPKQNIYLGRHCRRLQSKPFS